MPPPLRVRPRVTGYEISALMIASSLSFMARMSSLFVSSKELGVVPHVELHDVLRMVVVER
jgi:hypothetical protein